MREVCQTFASESPKRFLDCTFGGGGHSTAVLDANLENTVVGVDRDGRAIERGQHVLERYAPRLTLIHSPFGDLLSKLNGQHFDGVLADLGFSTDQMREGRGFSFADQDALDMRMDERSGSSAEDLVNSFTQQELYVVLKKGGVGQEAKGVARAIVEARPISKATQLAAIVQRAIPSSRSRPQRVHPATVVFQAFRIAVNDELGEIERLMTAIPSIVCDGGRCAIITFHSLEDRIVTSTMRSWAAGPQWSASSPIGHAVGAERRGRLITRKPICADEIEIDANPSARSAGLRVFEFAGKQDWKFAEFCVSEN